MPRRKKVGLERKGRNPYLGLVPAFPLASIKSDEQLAEHVREILASVLASREEHGDLVILVLRNDAGGEQAGARFLF